MELNEALENQVKTLAQGYIGVGSDSTYFVKAWDDHLRDFDIKTENPFMVIAVRNVRLNPTNIGAPHGDKVWDAAMYFLHVNRDWNAGKTMRNKLISRLMMKFEANQLLSAFTYTSGDNITSQVWTSQFESATFDESGEDGYYTFVSEMHLSIGTSTT